MTDPILVEAKRLYDLGFGVHWLHDRSKRPLESGWTTGPRKNWKYLKETYRKGLNVGVRLGTPSKIKNNFLAVLDVDIKSGGAAHGREVQEHLKTLGGKLTLPEVKSGRGNGSRHYYILTPEPIKPFKARQSTELVKVPMPSVAPSKRELKLLTLKEIAEGVRLRPAWEIAVMGEGQQVVLPPSIHPDSGLSYKWQVNFDAGLASGFDMSQILKPSKITNLGSAKSESKPGPKTIDDFEMAPVELSWLPLNEKIKQMILTGEGVEDRSAMLLPVSQALLRAGLTRNEILTVLTDPDTFLGKCAYQHAKTTNRVKAARWVYSYTLARVIKENSNETRFADPIVELRPLSPEVIISEQEFFDSDVENDNGFYFVGAKGGLIPDYESMLAHFKEELPFKTIAEMKSVYHFDETHYRDLTSVEIKGFAEDNFKPPPPEKYRLEFLNKVLANNIERRNFFVETTENKINFKNGVLAIDDEGFMGPKLLEHSPEYGFRGVLPYAFDAKAKCPFFKKWLNSIMLNDQDLVSLLQEFMGYIIRGGEYKYHKALWLGGSGRNGKSTFVDLLKALIGSGNFSTISIKSLMNDRFAGADLDGKTANFSEETSPQELADSGPFKNLTGNGEIFAQKKFGDPYSFRNRAKLVMTYNIIPDIKDLSKGMLSRPIIIPFRKTINDADQDREINKKLFQELPGIFNFAFEGWERLESQNDFTKSELSDNALRRVKEESCNVFQWVENNLTFKENFEDDDFLVAQQLYAAYCKREKYQFKFIEFCRRLNAHPGVHGRVKRMNTGMRYFGVNIMGSFG